MKTSLLAMYMCATVHGYAVAPKEFASTDEMNRYSYWTTIEQLSSSLSTIKHEIAQLNENVNSIFAKLNKKTRYGWEYLVSYYDTYEDAVYNDIDYDPFYSTYYGTYAEDDAATYQPHYSTYDTYEIYDTYEPDENVKNWVATDPAPDYDAMNAFDENVKNWAAKDYYDDTFARWFDINFNE